MSTPAQSQIASTLKLLEFEWSSPISLIDLRTPTSVEYVVDEKDDDDELLFSRTPKRRSCILNSEAETEEYKESPEVKIQTFNCWNIDRQITADQVNLYMDIIRINFDAQTHPTIFLLQGIGSKFKNELAAVYPDNIMFYDIYGVNKERIDAANIAYVPDYKDRYCAILWSDNFVLAQSMIPSYTDNHELGRRTSDWLVFQSTDGIGELIAIANIWLSPQKRTTKKEKPICILQSILDEAELLKDFGYKIIVAGTFNMVPDVMKEYINGIDLEYINADKSTIQYISPNMLGKPSHVDYGLFWGFDNIQEEIIAVANSHHSMVHYRCG